MSITIVQSQASDVTSNTTTISATLPAATTAGNLIVASVVWHGTSAGVISAPAGWTQAWTSTGSGVQVHTQFYWLDTAGGHTSFTFTWNSTANGVCAALYELHAANGWAATPLDGSASNFSSSNTTTETSGTTAATTSASEIAIASFSNGANTLATNWTAPTNGYTSDLFIAESGATSQVDLQTSYKILTATGAGQSTGFTVASTAKYSAGIGTYAEAAGGSPIALSGTLPSGGALTGALTVTRAISGEMPSGGALSASLSVTTTLASEMPSGGGLSGALVASKPFSGVVPSASGLSGALVASKPLAGEVPSGGALSGGLSVNGAITVANVTGWPFGLSPHPSATFSDGAHLALFYDGVNLVSSLSTDGGVTWAAKVTVVAAPNVNGGQLHFDTCQQGDTLYGALLTYNSGGLTWQVLPYRLAYAAGAVTVTTAAAFSVANVAPATANPDAGGAEISVTYDADHSLYHVGVNATTGVALYALTASALATSYSLTTGGPVAHTHNAAIVYVRGTLWCGTDNVGASFFPLTVNSLTAGPSAYGTWSASATVTSDTATVRGLQAFLDTTQATTQPGFVWSSGSGTYCATYNGTTWGIQTLTSGANDFGAAIQCVGTDLWMSYVNSGVYLVKRTGGTWGAATLIDANGDRSGWTSVNQSSGVLLLIYTNGAGNAVYARPYTPTAGATALSGEVPSGDGLSATLTLTRPLASAIASGGGLSGALTVTKALAGVVPAGGGLSGVLSVQSATVALSGALASGGALSAALLVTRALTLALASGGAIPTAALSITRLLSVALASGGGLSAALTVVKVVIPPVGVSISASASGPSGLSASLTSASGPAGVSATRGASGPAGVSTGLTSGASAPAGVASAVNATTPAGVSVVQS